MPPPCMNRFDLNLLIAFDALLHEKNATRAAERVLGLSPRVLRSKFAFIMAS